MKKKGNLRITINLIMLAGKTNFIIFLGFLLGFIGEAITVVIVGLGACGIVKFLGFNSHLEYTTIFVLVMTLAMFRALLKFFEQHLDNIVSQRYITKVRSKLFNKLEELSPNILENKNYGDLITSLTTDISNIELFYKEIASPIGVAVLIAGVFSLLIFISNGIIPFILVTFSFFVIGFIMPLISQILVKKKAINYQESLASFNDYYLDSLIGAKDIVVSKCEEKRKLEIEKRSLQLQEDSKKLNVRTSIAFAITSAVSFLFIFIYILISAFVTKDENIYILVITVSCYFMALKPVIKLTSLAQPFSLMIASATRILEIMKRKPLNPKINNGINFEFEKLEMNKVSFSYPDGTEIFKRINLTVNKGDVIAIIGQNGSGKTTLFKLLMQQYFPTSGKILYNDKDISLINTSSIYDNVNIFSEACHIFNDSVKNNLLIAKPDATTKEVMDACKMANIHDVIVSLPRGYNTVLNETTDNLSIGERQRIGLARVFLAKPKLLLLDEPTSNVDAISEKLIMTSLMENKKDMTIIIISHRASTVNYASVIYKIKNGLLILEK